MTFLVSVNVNQALKIYSSIIFGFAKNVNKFLYNVLSTIFFAVLFNFLICQRCKTGFLHVRQGRCSTREVHPFQKIPFSRKTDLKYRPLFTPAMQKPRNAGLQNSSQILKKYTFGHMIKLSANIRDFPANMTKIVCKCLNQLEFQTPAFRGFCKPGSHSKIQAQMFDIFLYRLIEPFLKYYLTLTVIVIDTFLTFIFYIFNLCPQLLCVL